MASTRVGKREAMGDNGRQWETTGENGRQWAAMGDNGQLLRRANREGLRINVSTETEESADRAIASGLPAVLAVSSEETRTVWRTPARNLVKVCPAQLRDTDCNRCMLCHKRGSKVIIAFLAHGSRKTRANQQLNHGTV